MIHYVRTQGNDTLLDIEATDDDIQCSLDKKLYGSLFLYLIKNYNLATASKFGAGVSIASEIKEYYLDANHNHETTDDLAEFVCNWIIREFPEPILSYTTD